MAGSLVVAQFLVIWSVLGQFSEQTLAQNVQLRRDPLTVLRDGKIQAIHTAGEWPSRRASILQGMESAMGPFPPNSIRGDLRFKRLDTPVRVSRHTRQKVSFEPSPGTQVKAWLLVPHASESASQSKKYPAMLCLHQTIPIGKDEPAGLGPTPSKRQAFDLADRGFVCLAPDYPSFGEYPCDFKDTSWKSGTMLAIWNNSRAVDLLCSLPEVDPARVGAIGHSLGGHNTLFTAVFEPRIRVAVTSCGFTSFPRYMKGDLTGWTSNRYMPRISAVYAKDPARMPFDFPEVLAAIAPRAVFISAPTRDDNFDLQGVRDSVATAAGVFRLLGVPDRLQLRAPEGGHDFQEETRLEAYDYIAKVLAEQSANKVPDTRGK